jgi:hypothetical protein
VRLLVDVYIKISVLLDSRGDEVGAKGQLEYASELMQTRPNAVSPEIQKAILTETKRLRERTGQTSAHK